MKRSGTSATPAELPGGRAGEERRPWGRSILWCRDEVGGGVEVLGRTEMCEGEERAVSRGRVLVGNRLSVGEEQTEKREEQ